MTAWWRTWWVTGAALLACGTIPSYGVQSTAVSASPSASASSSPADPDRAGSVAGEGRVRPGRSVSAPEDDGEEADEDVAEDGGEEEEDGEEAGIGPAPSPPPATTPTPSTAPQSTAAQAAEPTGRVLRILPLGSGLILIGLGFGLAFFALRLRRD